MKKILISSLCAFSIVMLCSHDYYLLPVKYFLQKGDTLITKLYAGDAFILEEEKPFQQARVTSYDWIVGDKTESLLHTYKDSTYPVLSRRMDKQGLGLVSMERNYAYISFTPEKFQKYLEEERIQNTIELRKTMPAREAEREKYTRYLKSLVMVGNAKGDVYKRMLGHKLELILLQNPYAMKKGQELTAQVFFRGKPLAGASLEVMSKDASGKIEIWPMTSGADGKITFKPLVSGEWVVRLVHMIPCESCADADWESFWASYTFAIK